MNKVTLLKNPVLLFSALVLIFVFTSCSKEKQDSAPYSAESERPSSSQSSDANKDQEAHKNDVWVEYFDNYFDTSKSTELTNKAMDLLTAKCMKDKGFDYKMDTKKDDRISTFPFKDKLVGDPDWGTTDVEYAKVYGYLPPQFAFMLYENIPGIGGDTTGMPKAPQEEKDLYDPGKIPERASIEKSKNTPEYNQAYGGENGCSNTGETDFYKGLNTDVSRSDQIGQLRAKIREMATDDSQFTPKINEWSECIKPKGFVFNFPPAAKKANGELLKTTNPSYGRDNTLLATADAECKQQTGFIDAWHKVLDEVEERELKNNLPIFEAEKAYTDSMINRANEIIEKYGNEFK
ncbi:MAG: hypothetical protein LBI63_05175 [Candidatus Ancillula sp.]|jgi:hypothetical protein|nr:hypothetical protein [Candidatus Ancillula sp.]